MASGCKGKPMDIYSSDGKGASQIAYHFLGLFRSLKGWGCTGMSRQQLNPCYYSPQQVGRTPGLFLKALDVGVLSQSDHHVDGIKLLVL